MERIGRYEVERELGRGGQAVVYLARDPVIGRHVAIKLLLPLAVEAPGSRERFLREARAIAALDRAPVATVFDFGEHDGQPFLVMAYLEGGSLADLRKQRLLGAAEALTIIERVAEALDAAHAAGVIHRDVKPANVLFDRAGNAYLADFGIARTGDSGATLTGTHIVGTAAYMSPEQARGQDLGPEADIYSLAAMSYELYAGKPPFEGPDVVSVVLKQVSETPRPPEALNPALPPAASAVIMRGLAKDPAARYPSAGAFAAVLREALRDHLGTEQLPDVTSQLAAAGATTRPSLPARRSPLLLVGGTALGLAVAAGGIFGALALFGGGSDAGSFEVVTGALPRGEPRGGIAFARSRSDGSKDIFVVNEDGSGETNLTARAGSNEDFPAWSPDARSIAFAADFEGSQFDIWVMPSEGGRYKNLTAGSRGLDAQPAWSTTGRIAFTSDRESPGGALNIWTMNEDGSDLRQLTRDAGNNFSPSWSPDGRQIVFVSTRDGGQDLYVMDADGSNLRAITRDANDDNWPRWSPDGTMIAFESTRGSGTPEVYVMNAQASATPSASAPPGVRLSRNKSGNPSWAPDSRSIVYLRDLGDGENLVVLSVNTTEVRVLTTSPEDDFSPAWSPVR